MKKILSVILLAVGLIFVPTGNVAFANAQSDVAKYTQEINSNPNNAEAYFNRGNAYLGLGQYERAIQDYDKAIQLKPNYSATYNNRGNAYYHLGQHERAIQDYDKAIQIKPNYANAYCDRGWAYIFGLKQNEKGLADLDKAISLDPDNAFYYYSRSLAYGVLAKLGASLRDINKAIAIEPNKDYYEFKEKTLQKIKNSSWVNVTDYYVFTDRDGTDYYIHYIEYPGAAYHYAQITKVDLTGIKNGKKVLGGVSYTFNPDGSYIAVSGRGTQHGLISENAIAKKVYAAINSEDIQNYMVFYQ